jgi:hypothetical protein
MEWWLWLVIAIIAVVGVAGAAYTVKQGSEAKRRHDAESLREDVRQQHVEVQHKEAAAMEARAEAEEARLRAARLDDEVASDRDDMQEHVRKADHVDPDVDDARHRDTGEAGAPRT